ncbi:MAG: Asp-tRNA(Asn)/Glu-tRNA(Gln) amidotransferase subunit GatB [Candidatus Saganbacteria bacterium]|nr:Asp-tRNA(Asn)/Glu-tRNA(Gln) amidotransferase subunit GatB [Candidatus Saganbacteria bacterium]
MQAYETIIGLEIHAQLLTESKMFCSCSAKFGAKPNTNICPICTGQPGVLPKMNKKAIEFAIKTGLAINCKIAGHSIFARKNYFYPDLPKGYQISQFELPLATAGHFEIELDGKTKKIGITRVHLEEDAGKLVHKGAGRIMGSEGSLVDFNRTGVPLMEIVTEPDIRSPEEAKIFTEDLANLLKSLGVCDAKMEEGSLRCDANLSIRPAGSKEFGVKTEVKNMNSFRAVLRALEAEEKRHIEVALEGGKIIQETRYFDDITETTTSMRSKESAHDYRYFPEPDLVPLEIDKSWIEEIKQTIGELPHEKKTRFIKDLDLPPQDAEILTASKTMADYFEECIELYGKPKIVSNWLLGDLSAYLNENKLDISEIDLAPAELTEMLKLIDKGTISGKIAKTVLVEMLRSGKSVHDIISEKGLTQISDEKELIEVVEKVIIENPKTVEDYKKGKETSITFLVGQVMKATKGRAKPDLVNKLLKEELSKI